MLIEKIIQHRFAHIPNGYNTTDAAATTSAAADAADAGAALHISIININHVREYYTKLLRGRADLTTKSFINLNPVEQQKNTATKVCLHQIQQ